MKTKDIIITGVYAAMYFIFVCLGTLVSVLVEHNANMKYAPAFTALFAGTVYMLLIAKTKKNWQYISASSSDVTILFLIRSFCIIVSTKPHLWCGSRFDC